VPLLHGFSNFSVCFPRPYSCLLFNMCNAYAEVELLVLIYHVCSLCLMVIDLPDCPMNALLQVLHNVKKNLSCLLVQVCAWKSVLFQAR